MGLTPSSSQLGTAPVLVRNVKLSGHDEVGASVERVALPDVTTNLSNVSQAGGGTKYAGETGFTILNANVVK